MVTKPNIREIANKYQLSEQEVIDIYYSMFEFIRKKIVALPELYEISEEDFNKLRTNFSIPVIGKMGIPLKRLKYINSLTNGKTIKSKRNKADVHGNCDNDG